MRLYYSDNVIKDDFSTVDYESKIIDHHWTLYLISFEEFKHPINTVVIPMSLLFRLELSYEETQKRFFLENVID